jgi:hypothetical protein
MTHEEKTWEYLAREKKIHRRKKNKKTKW